MTRSDSEALLRSADRYGMMLLQLYPFKRKLPLAGQLPKLKKLPALGLGLIFALSRVVM